MGKGFAFRKPTHKDYRAFLDKVLKTIRDTNCNQQAVERLLRENLDKLDDKFAQVLRNWATVILAEAEPTLAHDIATAIVNFSRLIQGFPSERTSNLEITITCYEVVAPVLNREVFAWDWVQIQRNLLIQIIHIVQATQDSEDDSKVVYRLLNANLNKLDSYFAQLLRESTKTIWSKLEHSQLLNLAIAIFRFSVLISEFQGGNTAKNLEISIAGYEAVNSVFTHEAFPARWALTQNNLGNAYGRRIYGDRVENLKTAIKVFQESLQIRNCEESPLEWALTLNNLGNAYRELGQIDQAITAFLAASQVYTREDLLKEWAAIQNNLGITYLEKGDIDKAIAAFLSALHMRTFKTLSQEWAGTQNNLGIAYRKRGLINEAVTLLQEVLCVYTLEDFPEYWAETTNTLGEAFRDKGQIDKAIECFQLALKEVFTPQNFPIKCLESGCHLGDIAFSVERWDKAIEGYYIAIEAVEQSREWASSDGRKAEILSADINVYAGIVQAYINKDQPDKAIEYVERSKARNLVELLANKNLYPKRDLYPNPKTYQTHCNQLDQLRREIPTQQRQLEILISSRESEERYHDQIEQRRQELNNLKQQQDELLREINKIDSTFTFTQKVEPIPFGDIQALIDENTAIIEWYITGNQILTFIITRHNPGIKVWSSTTADLQALIAWNDQYLQDLKDNRPHWQKQLPDRLKTLAEILHLDEILTLLPDTCNQLILIPHRFLHLFPIHALPLSGGTYLLDHERCRSGLRYAPSCQLLQLTQKQNRSDLTRLFAIQDPEQNLPFANAVVETIHQYFPRNAQILVREAATKEALNNLTNAEFLRLAHCILFSGHGVFNYESPLQSCLKLANNTRLTLGEIFGMNFRHCSLVTLSACETGVADPTSISDEYISLPSGFLFAGSPRVVSSLWEVSSISTTLLMREFYKNLLENLKTHQKLDVALALNKAQKWLRELTSEQCEEILRNELKLQIYQIIPTLPRGKQFVFKKSLEAAERQILDQPYPFASPYYWAAFTVAGV